MGCIRRGAFEEIFSDLSRSGPGYHPVRSAESAAVLDLLSDGRVEFGTGRSSTRAELEGRPFTGRLAAASALVLAPSRAASGSA